MRKLIVSNLLLIMFLVGAASGFFLGTIGWWGLHEASKGIDQLYRTGGETLKQISDVEKMTLRSQALFLDALKKRELTVADKGTLTQADSELRQMLSQLQHNSESGEQWDQIVYLYTRLSASRQHALALLATDTNNAYYFHTTNTLPLFNQMLSTVQQFVPRVSQAMQREYDSAHGTNDTARDILLAIWMLASVCFCLTAWMTYRESMDRRKKTAQLNKEHTLFRTLFESSNDGIILLHDGRILDLSRAAFRLFAVAPTQSAEEIRLDWLQPAQQPDGLSSSEGLMERISESLRNGPQRFEWQFKSLDGREFPAELAIDVAHLADKSIVQLTVRDISRRKQNETSMRLANQAFENSLEGIAITDAHGNILTVNNAFTAITGYDLDEVLGRNPRLLSSGRQTRDFYDEMWKSIDESGKWQGEIWNIRKNGDIYPQWLNISRVTDEHGNITNFVGVFSDISERKSAEERILHQVYYDQLTDLPNRVLFTDRLNQVMGIAKRHQEHHFAVMFLDLDRFKLINDSMGHDAGDQLLQQAAHRLRGSIRESDTVARMGGDEFTIVLSEIANPKHAANVAQKILDAFCPPFHLNGEEVYVSVSIGISVYPDDGNNVELLLKNADMAMYRAKSAGGSWYELYDEGLGTQASQRLMMETALHKALERDELELQYQPQFDCDSGKLIGFEALLRWRHPERGLLAAESFLNIAEETGLIVPIGAWVLRTACAQAQAWRREFPGHRLMAVNLSGRQFQSADLSNQIAAALHSSGLPHFCLELEITEGVLMQNLDASIDIMHHLAELGVQFSIDDFGTGHSSLAYLKKLPIHSLKIDRSFIRDLTTGSDDATIVSAIIAMANKLGLRVVAEGIESQAQLALLKAYRGIVGQGYLLGKPMSAESASKLIGEGRARLAVVA
ncbi:EAL domain-containing protein [Noviherbaspirillum sp.]|jgi:diguanylate cyclase (GGDEF)-like protein/PAS domain S-box-containing protein|uniref:putative bifunctional diguanylate cyclase/phosphodiesterase n=1 Tax=Noviherbaspirillum sp. TaxID=1926288 RepID=UPI0025FA8008|nr:EAL domain-containing protein [Noviherbaspirillum sp.]